ncbi:MAG: biotin--[acetyl-CoA-carboxylase] ligase [Veillonella caviae]|uniref:biotin--[acetyl-CoA-carboxylase] ligase n=1 Tax=Veillonella caviae TaxID=248316 RepID=UPI002A91B28D|nr:biotin--[acetyl-CoA-carboxylase] ligase [Veillonella caviae]MDY5481908.1 biotin--[acetyl-CoA-carboxylase] ligase [Veillonella caviae]
MRDEVLEFLRENQGGFVSGQDMSEACHVSRTAIWKHIKALRQKGYKIESYTKRGYRLLEEPDLLSPLAMKQILNTDVFGKRYVYMDTTESTNLEARRLAQQGAEEGTVVVSEEQAAGRGRVSRGWHSPFGKGLWFSLVLRPDFVPSEAPKCTLMAAVALTKAFHKMGLTSAGIKWPNDILVNGRKMVGILTEMSGSMEEISYIIMGIGVNVKTKQEELPEEIKYIATSLLMEGIDIERTEAFKIILENLEYQYYEILDKGFDETLDEWRKLSVTLGQEIEVRAPDNIYEGIATDIDEDGNLLVKTLNGDIKRIVVGDVSIRPRK